MTRILYLPTEISHGSLPPEILSHIANKYSVKNSPASFAAYEALCRLSVDFGLTDDNRRLPFVCYTEKGKPFFRDYPLISFSLSHTDGMSCAVMSDSEEVGIDIERIRSDRIEQHRTLSARRFSSVENLLIEKAFERSSLEGCKQFLSFWTQKESVGKLLGISPITVDTQCLSENIRIESLFIDGVFALSCAKKSRTSAS